jgi:PAS domain S-box-containing protein
MTTPPASTPPASVLDLLPVHVWLVDPSGAVTRTNRPAQQYLGRTHAQLAADGWQSGIHPADLPEALARWREAQRTARPFEVEFRLQRASDGLFRWFLARGEPDRGSGRDAAGRGGGWALTHTDINDRKRADEVRVARLVREEEARARAEAERTRYESFFRQAPVAIAISRGPEHVLSFLNERYQALTGRGRAQLGLSARQRMPELEGQGFFELLDQVYETGVPYVGTEQPARFDRTGTGTLETGYFNFVYQPMRDVAGNVEGIFTLAVEVTDMVLARRKAEETATQLGAILRQSADGIIVTDAGGRISFVNARAAALHGVSELGVPVDDYTKTYRLFTLEGRPFPPEALPLARAVTRKQTVRDALWRIRRPDGTEVVAQGSAAPTRGEDLRWLGAVLVLRDVTEQFAAHPEPLLALARAGEPDAAAQP